VGDLNARARDVAGTGTSLPGSELAQRVLRDMATRRPRGALDSRETYAKMMEFANE